MLAIDAYERRERSAYWRSGLVAASIVNANRKKGQRAVTPEDFIPEKRRQPQSAVQMAEMLKAATVAMGGQVITGGD